MRTLLLRFILLTLTLFTLNAWSQEKLIIEPDEGRAPILAAIAQTQSSLDLVMYGFTDERILQAILAQKKQGKNVKIILEEHPFRAYDENEMAIQALNVAHIPWQGSVPSLRLIHQKTLLIDGRKALVMTFNFTHLTFKKERNFALLIDDPAEVKEITHFFNADWQHRSPTPSESHLIWSPDSSRTKLLQIINDSTHSLQIYAQNFTDFQIAGALARAAERGVNVQLLTSNTLKQKQANYLTRHGVHIRYTHQLIIHAKVMIIDQEKAVIGSINFTRPSLNSNRELAVITEDKETLRKLIAVFNKDWRAANPLTAISKQWMKKMVRSPLLQRF